MVGWLLLSFFSLPGRVGFAIMGRATRTSYASLSLLPNPNRVGGPTLVHAGLYVPPLYPSTNVFSSRVFLTCGHDGSHKSLIVELLIIQ